MRLAVVTNAVAVFVNKVVANTVAILVMPTAPVTDAIAVTVLWASYRLSVRVARVS